MVMARAAEMKTRPETPCDWMKKDEEQQQRPEKKSVYLCCADARRATGDACVLFRLNDAYFPTQNIVKANLIWAMAMYGDPH